MDSEDRELGWGPAKARGKRQRTGVPGASRLDARGSAGASGVACACGVGWEGGVPAQEAGMGQSQASPTATASQRMVQRGPPSGCREGHAPPLHRLSGALECALIRGITSRGLTVTRPAGSCGAFLRHFTTPASPAAAL